MWGTVIFVFIYLNFLPHEHPYEYPLGSNLVSKKTGKHGWISTSTVLKNTILGNQGHASIAKSLSWSADGSTFSTNDDFEPVSLVDLFTKPWDEWCNSLDPNRVDVQYYLWDWRLPLEQTLSKFEDWIVQQDFASTKRALLVSYSTASLFAWPVINKYPDKFSGWLNVGGAIGGGNFILNDFSNGWYKSFACLLSAESVFRLPSCIHSMLLRVSLPVHVDKTIFSRIL